MGWLLRAACSGCVLPLGLGLGLELELGLGLGARPNIPGRTPCR